MYLHVPKPVKQPYKPPKLTLRLVGSIEEPWSPTVVQRFVLREYDDGTSAKIVHRHDTATNETRITVWRDKWSAVDGNRTSSLIVHQWESERD
jgi:hypothetical protein